MKLTNTDKDLLKEWGYPEEDFDQIERAMLTKYTTYELDGKRIARKDLLPQIKHEEFLSGLARSAFHWSAVRETTDGKNVYFDSSKLFK